jgi:transposase
MRKPASFYFSKRKPIVLRDRYECWRGVADISGFTTQERLRVEWMVFCYAAGRENAALTAQHFGISKKTFYKWFRRFRDSKYDVDSLADRSRAPHGRRHWEVSLIQEERIRRLRKRYPYYGKKKLKVIYEKEYSEEISTWKIERVSEDISSIPTRIRQRRLPEREPELKSIQRRE